MESEKLLLKTGNVV